MCCEERPRRHAGPMLHDVPLAGVHGTCDCHERGFLSKKERIEMLEEYRESLKCKLEGVEEELKGLQIE